MISGCEADCFRLALPSEVDPKRSFALGTRGPQSWAASWLARGRCRPSKRPDSRCTLQLGSADWSTYGPESTFGSFRGTGRSDFRPSCSRHVRWFGAFNDKPDPLQRLSRACREHQDSPGVRQFHISCWAHPIAVRSFGTCTVASLCRFGRGSRKARCRAFTEDRNFGREDSDAFRNAEQAGRQGAQRSAGHASRVQTVLMEAIEFICSRWCPCHSSTQQRIPSGFARSGPEGLQWRFANGRHASRDAFWRPVTTRQSVRDPNEVSRLPSSGSMKTVSS